MALLRDMNLGGQREIADKAVVNARQVKLMLNRANEVRNLVNARNKQRVKLSEAG